MRANNLDDPETLENHSNPLIKKIIVQTLLTLPVDEKVNGYGLNFVGRNFARAKYAQKTEKELRLNRSLSVAETNTQNLVLKGDNLDSLKILKSHYTGKIKCIYIDPPYNTTSDEFVYPDKFDKEEAEVLGLANLSDDDFARMDFSFKTKKSHNGWLAFMYPRLLLARDLLSKDGVIFISIDDNEQANLKLLCDDVFGEENFVANLIWERAFSPKNDAKFISNSHDYVLMFAKSINDFDIGRLNRTDEANARYSNPDNDPRGVWMSSDISVKTYNAENDYPITTPSGRVIEPPAARCWRLSKNAFFERLQDNRIWFGADGNGVPRIKRFLAELKFDGMAPTSILAHKDVGHSQEGAKEVVSLFEDKASFDGPKPVRLLKRLLTLANTEDNSIILDFFAGSGTTGHAVMQLNAEDASTGSAPGNRKFILCQIDEPIKEDKPAYKFCIDNNLPPVISSITIERLKRAGKKIAKEIEEANNKNAGKLQFDNSDTERSRSADIGFKVFDSVEAPKLKVDETGQISIEIKESDALSRIYNMIFTVGLDEPTQVPEEVVKDCIYKIGNHYYITNSERITNDDFSDVINASIRSAGKVFIDGWTASLNGTLQNYKEDVKIVF
ncbi:MAG: site-specific DNA-methyltransferase [Leptospiraceae bacterium]|nr:site-specific DNA-methyltransferase [Leptospiraceae bacterium]